MDLATNDIGFTPDLPKGKSSIIKVLGVGGGGNNALKQMYDKGINGVDFVVFNTDQQALDNSPVPLKVQLGAYTTEGLGAGGDPEVGEKAALESIDDIKASLGSNTKMVFITTGMGGGTGTGAAPIIAKVARELGILTVAVVTMPFGFEGKTRRVKAEAGIERLKENVDSLIVINNDKVAEQFPDLEFDEAFLKADDILTNAVKGMAEMVSKTFYINVDFRDAKTVLQNSGTALMSIGIASGENRAEEAVKKALDSPLLNNSKINGAKNVLVLIQAGADHKPKISELNLIPEFIQNEAGGDNEANVIWGVGVDEELGEAIKVLVIATGFSEKKKEIIIFPEEEITIEKEPAVEEQPKEEPKIIFPLEDTDNDEPLSKSFSGANEVKPNVIPTPTSVASTPQISEKPTERKVFRLDDIDETKANNTPTNAHQMLRPVIEEPETMVLEKEEKPHITFTQEEEITTNAISFVETIEEPEEEINLFSSFDGENTVSFTFDIANQEEDNISTFQAEESEIQFGIREETPITEKEEEISFGVKEIEHNETPIFEPKAVEISSPKEEIKPEISLEVEQKEEFTIIEKKTEDSPKVMERRNKLKDFNSRYYTLENMDTFESIPAFRRKNIDLNLENASEQRITNFISEENGQTKLKENRFLNKDVD